MVPSDEPVKMILAKAMGIPDSSFTIPSILVWEKAVKKLRQKKTGRYLFMFRYMGQLGRTTKGFPFLISVKFGSKVVSYQKLFPKKAPTTLLTGLIYLTNRIL